MPQETGLFWEPQDVRARERLRSLVGTFKGNEPLAPVSVVVPSTYAGLDLRHDLGRHGSANVQLLVLPRLAELLGAPLLAAQGRRPLTPLLEAAVVRAVAAEALGPLEAVGQLPALHRTLQATFRELRYATEKGLSRVAALGDLRAEVVRLYRLYRQRTDVRYYDREALSLSAARAVRDGAAPGLRDLGPVVFFLVPEFSPGEVALVEALAEHWSCAVVLGLTGEDAADASVRNLAKRLAPVLGPAREELSPRSYQVDQLVVTPDPQQEVRWILRRLMRAAEEGMPFHRMALLYRQPAPYASLLPEELSLSGVPQAGPGNAPLAESAAGRTLLGMMHLVGSDLPRSELMAWLTGCPVAVPAAPHSSFQPSYWDTVSRRAGVVGGLAQWRQRLGRHAVEMERALSEGLELGDLSEARAARMSEESAAARSLLGFMEGLVDRLRPPPDGSDWSEFARWTRQLLAAYLDRRAVPDSALDAEDAAYQRIDETLEEMRMLDEVEPHPSLEEFRQALEEALALPLGHLGQTGRGVFVAPLGVALGMSFDLVCVVGMVEGAVPPPHSDDPLLPDHDRQRAGGLAAGITLRGSRDNQERHRYLAALATGEHCILSFPNANPGAQRGQFPSRWFLEAAMRLHGAPVYTSNLWSLGSEPWLTIVASLEDGLRSVATEAPADIHDRDVYHLWRWRRNGEPMTAHYLASSGHLSRSLALEQGRAQRQLTRWDGDVSSLRNQARRLRLLGRPVLSPSSLETWATCPFRYFMGNVLGIAAVEEPEEVWTISSLEKGSLIHRVLDRFIRAVRERGDLPSPNEPWRPEHRNLLGQLTEEAFAEAESRGVTGKALLWEMQQEAIRSDLEAFLEADATLRARFGVTPHLVEVGFGLRNVADGDSALPPVERQVPAIGTLRFRGMVDRVDLDASGQVALVLDYKTGGASSYEALKKDPVDAGRRLQLPIYTLALQDVLGKDVAVYAAYWFVSARGKFVLLPPEPVELSQVAESFDSAVGAIAQGIAAGLFPANPGAEEQGGFANCSWCDFESLCPSRRDVLWQRKQADPRLQAYMRLQIGQPAPEEVEE